MKLTQEEWLKQFEIKGNADETFLVMSGKEYTPRELAGMDYVFWKHIVKNI